MRIAHVLPANIPVTSESGGALERRALAMADEQARRGNKVEIYSANDGATHVRASGVIVRSVTVRSPRPFCDVEYLLKVSRSMKSKPVVDILHSHGQPLSAQLLGRYCRASIGQFDFYQFRGSSNALVKSRYKRALEQFTTIAAVSQFTAIEMTKFYGIERPVSVLHNGVDLEEFTPTPHSLETLSRNYPDTEHPYVLYVGRINEQKGSDRLPRIAEGLAESGIKLLAVGPVGQFGASGKTSDPFEGTLVNYLGVAPKQDLPGLMAGASALVLPTRRHEMFGMVIVEAGACGTPAVASNLGGIPEALGRGGILVDNEDGDGFLLALRELLSNEAARRDLAGAALENSHAFSWRQVDSDAWDLYQNALEQQP